MLTSGGSRTTPLRVVARVRTLMRQMVTLLKTMATYEPGHSVFEKSIDMLYTSLKGFLEEHETLALRIRKKEIAFGDQVVYVPIGRSDAFIYPLHRDGVRELTFNKDLTKEELTAFATTLVGAKETDPYESDLVTALWERDLANITYEADDVYLERDESEGIERLGEEVKTARDQQRETAGTQPAEFLLTELDLASNAGASLEREVESLGEEDIEKFRLEIAAEDDSALLEKSSSICLEILESTSREDVFRRTARFLGEICDWLVSVQKFMPVCSIISDLRSISERPGVPESTREAIADLIRKRGERDRLLEVDAYVEHLTDAKMEELFCYLGQMEPIAIKPLCQMLAEAETRRVRYMLARAVSIVAKDSVEDLEPFLKDDRWYVVRNITMILGMIATEGTLPYLKQVVRHDEPRVRREAARALGRVKSAEGLPALKGLIQDENKMIRLAAFSAAGVIGGDEARVFLEEVALDPAFETKATDEKRRIMEVYGTLGNGSVEFLSAYIDGKHGAVSDNSMACAVYGLATAGGPKAKKTLQQLLEGGEGPVKYAASEAVSMLEGKMNVTGND